MLTAHVRKEAERRSANDPHGQIDEFWVDFETVGELENFLAYNRAYIKTIKFTGELTREEND